MRNKIIAVVVCALILTTTIPAFTDEGAEAAIIPPKPYLPPSILDMDEIYNVTYNLSRMINVSYEIGEYRKGRYFGSMGERASAEYLTDRMKEFGLFSYRENITGTNFTLAKDNDKQLETLGCSMSITNLSDATMRDVSVDCYISPRWTNDSSFHIPHFNPSKLDGVYEYSNLRILRCERRISTFIDDFFQSKFLDIIGNLTFNESEDVDYVTTAFEQYYNFSFEDIALHPENATGLPWYCASLFTNLSYVIIKENPSYHPDYCQILWIQQIALDKLPGIITIICDLLDINDPSPNEFKSFSRALALQFKSLKKTLSSSWLRVHPFCKGVIMYDYDDVSYDHQKNGYVKLPIIFINGSVGKMINASVEDFRVNFSINQRWNDSVISSNVIGQINGTDRSKTILITGFYDSWFNQGTVDAAIGAGIIMALAKKYKELDDSGIHPKHDLKFVLFGGEEAGLRGAYSYLNQHEGEDIPLFFDLNQLGMLQTDPKTTLGIGVSRPYVRGVPVSALKAIDYIAHSSGYEARNQNTIGLDSWFAPMGFLSNDIAFNLKRNRLTLPGEKVTTITFLRDSGWFRHHRTGMNHTEGDSMLYFDPTDVAATADLIFNATKFYCINPECSFDGDPTVAPKEDRSVNVTFTIETAMPEDRVWVRATLIHMKQGMFFERPSLIHRYTETRNYIVTGCSAVTDTITIAPGKMAPDGKYFLQLYLYNTTGEVKRNILPLPEHLDLGVFANDAYKSDYFTIARPKPTTPAKPTGDQTVETGTKSDYVTNTNSDDTLWYQWRYQTKMAFGGPVVDRYTLWVRGGPYGLRENCTETLKWSLAGDFNVSARVKDHLLNPNVMSDWSPKLLVTVTQANMNTWATDIVQAFSKTVVAVGQETSCGGLAEGAVSSLLMSDLNWTWDFGDGTISYDQNASHNYTQVGTYTVNLSIREDDTNLLNCSQTITVLVLSADFSVGGEAQPGKEVTFTDASAASGGRTIVNWTWDFGDGNASYLQNPSHAFAANGTYNVTLRVLDNASNEHVFSHKVVVERTPPEFVDVEAAPDMVGFGSPVDIVADFFEDGSGIREARVNITYPDGVTYANLSMVANASSEHDYTLTFNDTWQHGCYTYGIWVVDNSSNDNYLWGFNFTVTAHATISVSTIKDTYTGDEYINLTDPPGSPSPSLGYELVDDGAVLHLWNQYDSYYFNTSSGIQLTNHKDQYWSRNVLMLGYYNNDQWNLLYRTDELTGFSHAIQTDNTTYVNVTLWKDLTYAGYPFRLAIRYHLGANDNDLTIIPSIKNIGSSSIPYVLGFGWELKDIQINMTTQGDYILVDQDKYLLNQTLDNSFTNLNDTVFYLMEDVTGSQTQSLYLRWNPDLNYKLLVKSRSGQQNAPVTLFIRVGTLAVGQQKHTRLQWYDASQETFYFNGFDENEAWEYDPELMIDESEETFASTQLDGSVQLCNGNTCPGDDHGTILKVELRVHGYYEGRAPGNITLRPVFRDGELIGANYTFVAPDRPEWSDWFDITSDGGHGSGQWRTPWSWSEISTLDCDVEATLEEETTLYCSMVELRVTYNTAPTVSNPSPAYGVNGVGLQPWVNITISDPDEDSMNITWYSNSTPSLLTLRPNANGSSTELSKYPSSTQANYMCVDETVANDSDYVFWKGSSWKKDTYTLPNHTNQTGTINKITVYARCARVGSIQYPVTNSSAKIVIRINETYSYGSAFIPPYSAGPPVTYTNYAYTWTVNPVNGKNWTWTDIDNLQAGITFIGTQGTSQCSHLYVIVNYTNPNTWLQFGQNSSVSNGIYRQQFLNASVNGQWWYWKVKVEDGTASTWSSVYKFYTGYQSKIENTGETTIKGYLLMQVQYYNETSEEWMLDIEVVNQTMKKVINASEQLGLDQFFNGEVRTNDLTYGAGTYRVYAAFRDPKGNILNTSDETKLEAWWLFNKT